MTIEEKLQRYAERCNLQDQDVEYLSELLREAKAEAYEETLREVLELARYDAASGIDGEAFCIRAKDGEYLDRDDTIAAIRALKDSLVQETVSS
jgi:hypothetical protein